MGKRMNGAGSLYTRRGIYYLRLKDELKGGYRAVRLTRRDAQGNLSPCRRAKDAEAAAAEVFRQNAVLQEIKTREEAIYEISRTRRLIEAPELKVEEIWEIFRSSPQYNSNACPRHIRNLERNVSHFVAFCRAKGVNTIMKITQETVGEWLKTLQGRSNKTQNEYLSALKQVLRPACRKVGMAESPAEPFKARPRNSVGRQAFTPEQIEQIVDCFEKQCFRLPCRFRAHGYKDTGEHTMSTRVYVLQNLDEYYLVFLLGLMAGCRLGDAVSMRWENIDLNQRCIRYTPHKTAHSSGTSVAVPIVDSRLLKTLEKARRRGGERVTPFLYEEYRQKDRTVSHRFSKLFEAACGFSRPHKCEDRYMTPSLHGFHALRHTFVSFCANAGISLDICASIVGHSTVQTTQIYTHITEETKRKALSRVFGENKGDRAAALLKKASPEEIEKVLKVLGG